MSYANEVNELHRLVKENMKAGHGRQSLAKAKEQLIASQASRPVKTEDTRVKRHHGRTFIVSFLFGALWSGSRRR